MKNKIAFLLVIAFILVLVGCSDEPIDFGAVKVIGEKAYSMTSGLLLDGGFLKTDYDKDGHVLREYILRTDNSFLCHSYIDYEYDIDGKLLRTVRYVVGDGPYSLYTKEYKIESYFVYIYDEQGRPVMGTKYTDKGKLTDITVVMEYYDSGKLKSRSFYEDYYLTFLMEYDSLGRCTYQKNIRKNGENVAVLEYEGESGNVSIIDELAYDATVHISVEYDSAGNIILENEVCETYNSTVVRELEYYDGTDLVKSYSGTTTLEYYDDKGGKTSSSTVAYNYNYVYTDNGCVKECHTLDEADNVTYSIVFEYNSEGRLSEIRTMNYDDGIAGTSSVTTYEYDTSGNMITSIEDAYLADGGLSNRYILEYQFDENGNRTKVIHWDEDKYGVRELSLERNSRYDDKGNEVWISSRYRDADGTLRRGSTVERTFDALGNLIKEVCRNSEIPNDTRNIGTLERRYDERGNKLWQSYTYINDDGRVVYLEETYNVREYRTGYTEITTEANGVKSVYEIKYDNLGERVDSTYKKYDADGILIYSGKYSEDYGKG